MKIIFIAIIVAHGLIHLFGFAKGFRLADIPQLKQPIADTEAILWLLAAAFLLACMMLFPFNDTWFGITGIIGLLLSQGLIIYHWQEAKFGTIANLMLLLPLISAFAKTQPSGYYNAYRTEVRNGLSRMKEMPLLTETDIARLPFIVQKYIRNSGAIGKPKVHNFRIVFEGEIKSKPTAAFSKFHAEQYSFYDEPTRLFYINSKMWGIPFDGFHKYCNGKATMQVKVASLFKVADASGEKMTQSETVTMLNDMCIIAPATLIDKNIQWEPVDTFSVKAKFTNAGYTITATLFFNEKGELVNFSSDDRYMSADGKDYINYKWTTPVKEYKEFRGMKIASYGEALWHTPEGKFCYGKFRTTDVEYNCTQLPD